MTDFLGALWAYLSTPPMLVASAVAAHPILATLGALYLVLVVIVMLRLSAATGREMPPPPND
jgi:hypothetical protein